MNKLGLNTRAQIAAWAVEHGRPIHAGFLTPPRVGTAHREWCTRWCRSAPVGTPMPSYDESRSGAASAVLCGNPSRAIVHTGESLAW